MSIAAFGNVFISKCTSSIFAHSVRRYAIRKRFFKRTGILNSDGKYEVTLDQRKLKTPLGKPFSLESEPLAIAVAAEWDAQTEKIQQGIMYLSSLCNTSLDNPNNLSKYDMVNYLVNYLPTDTVLFQSNEEDTLSELQKNKWDPVIQWFCDKFQVDIKKTEGFHPLEISAETKATLAKHFLSYSIEAVNGYVYGVDTLKSVILMLACVERFITPDEAVYLSRLEEEHQLKYWGRVEWAHDMSQQELQARLCAAVLFVHLNSFQTNKVTKIPNKETQVA